MKKKNSLALVILIIIAIYTTGCSTVSVPIAVTHPAEINMSKYRQIAIGEFTGNLGKSVADSLKNKLVDNERFKVVDRSRMKQIKDEIELAQSDLSTSKNRIKLGKLLVASAFITGRNEGHYKETLTSKESTCINTDGDKYSCTSYKRTGIYTTSGSIDIIDVETGELIRSKLLNSSNEKTNYATNGTPEAIDKESLAGRCICDDVSLFLKSIMPWEEVVYAKFIKDKKIPSLEMGINQARVGDMAESIKTFTTATKNAEMNSELEAKNVANAYWNLGLAYEYSWNFDKAIGSFKKAFTINPKSMYLNEMKNAEKMKAEKKKLDQQNKDIGK